MNEKILAVITARGSSKGLPGKNILQVGGKPLLAWTIEAAKQSRYIDRLILSSDDDAESTSVSPSPSRSAAKTDLGESVAVPMTCSM